MHIGTKTFGSLTKHGKLRHTVHTMGEAIEKSLRGSAAVFGAWVARLTFWRSSRRKKAEEMFAASFNASYPSWVKKGMVKKPH